MRLTRDHVERMLQLYVRAWEEQNLDLLAKVFDEHASYQEGLASPMQGLPEIRSYWQKKVVESQSDISCRVVATYIDSDTAIAEWIAEFNDLEDGFRKRIRETAILDFCDGLVCSLRETWASEKVVELSGS